MPPEIEDYVFIKDYALSFLNFIRRNKKARPKQRQAVSPRFSSLLETVVAKIPAVFSLKRDFGGVYP